MSDHKKTSWEFLKEEMILIDYPRDDIIDRESIGYRMLVEYAVEIFMALSKNGYLNDIEEAKSSLRRDKDIIRILKILRNKKSRRAGKKHDARAKPTGPKETG